MIDCGFPVTILELMLHPNNGINFVFYKNIHLLYFAKLK